MHFLIFEGGGAVERNFKGEVGRAGNFAISASGQWVGNFVVSKERGSAQDKEEADPSAPSFGLRSGRKIPHALCGWHGSFSFLCSWVPGFGVDTGKGCGIINLR